MHTMRVKTAGGTIAAPALPTGTAAYTSSYLHHDQLGSVVAITSTAGVVVERLAYDPWGKRRFASGATTGNPDTLDAITGQYIDRGFTMHEHIDEMGIINMNGRIYDPLIGRFMSADPYIQAPDDLQSHNRYAYVMNNPLNLTDPSGFSWLSKAWQKAWKNPIFKAILGIAVGIIAPTFLVQFGGALFGATVGGVTTLSFAGTVVVGGLSGFAATGTLKGALTGAFTAGLMHGVGLLGDTLKLQSGEIGKIALHAGAGCISSVAGGGSCKSGAVSGAFGEFGHNIPSAGSLALDVARSAMLGGIGSKLAGGKFADGATTGAFGHLFNRCHNMTAECFKSTASNVGKGVLGAMTAMGGAAVCTSGIGCILGAPSMAFGLANVQEAGDWWANGNETVEGRNPIKEGLKVRGVSSENADVIASFGEVASAGALLKAPVKILEGGKYIDMLPGGAISIVDRSTYAPLAQTRGALAEAAGAAWDAWSTLINKKPVK
jgi:RHS repeat-associated protein